MKKYSGWQIKLRPKDFAIIVELKGNASTGEWQSALNQVQLQHANLSVRVTTNADSDLVLEPTESPIPFKIMNVDEQVNWQKIVEEERTIAFDITGPLVKVVVLQKQDACILILLTHHALFDGMSLTYLTRDILAALNHQFVPEPSVSKNMNELLGLPTDHPQQSTVLLSAERESSVCGQIEAFKLSEALTTKLTEYSKAEKTSVHGTLSAAVLLAGRKLQKDWNEKTVQLMSPVNVRKALNVGEECGLFVITEPFALQPDQALAFWDIARLVKTGFAMDKRAYTKAFTEGIQQLIFHIPDTNQIIDILKKNFNHQVMISNLGQLPYGSDFGKLKIKDFWGPIVLTGLGHVLTIGAVTVNGSLHLTNTSELLLPQLFETIEEILQAACDN